MPIALMLLFRLRVRRRAIDTGSGHIVNYLLPGILLITIATGIPTPHSGSYPTWRAASSSDSSPCHRALERPLGARPDLSWSPPLISLVLVVLVALLMGFRTSAGWLAWLAVAGILGLFTVAVTWIAVIAGLAAKSADGAGAFSYPIIFLPFISSAFVLTNTMPGPVRAFAEHQPVTSIVNAIRDLFAQQPVSDDVWVALAWCLGILGIAYVVAMATYHRKTA
jgi:ABC-2 type transport system permease protein